MKSLKPGRGPSLLGGIIGIFGVIFGIFWTVMAASAGTFFVIFGVIFTCAAIATTIYNFRNALGKNRCSSFDITDGDGEPDPLNERFGNPRSAYGSASREKSSYCPYCGTPAEEDFEFCRSCGRKLP